VGLYTELLCYHPYFVSMLSVDLLSLHLVTFLMIFLVKCQGGPFLGFPQVFLVFTVQKKNCQNGLLLTHDCVLSIID